MGYKLAIEKAHRKTKGGNTPRAINKREPDGRTLRVYQATEVRDNKRKVSEDHFVYVHATRKDKVRKLVLPPFYGAFA